MDGKRAAWIKVFAALTAVLSLAVGWTPMPASAAPDDSAQQIIAAINQDRAAVGLPALAEDPRLDAVAAARADYIMARGQFSHCAGGEADSTCPSGLDFAWRDRAAGLDFGLGVTVDENLALNNYGPADEVSGTNADWMNSPEHRSNILDGRVSFTGVAVVCCFVGTVNGLLIRASDNVSLFVQEFAGGPGAKPPTASGPDPGTASCRFVLGFAALAEHLGARVGQCVDNESHNPLNGDALQHTSTGGLLVWRKADNWTAFTDGFRTWVNGPKGLAERLNTQRFSWEANPDGLTILP